MFDNNFILLSNRSNEQLATNWVIWAAMLCDNESVSYWSQHLQYIFIYYLAQVRTWKLEHNQSVKSVTAAKQSLVRAHKISQRGTDILQDIHVMVVTGGEWWWWWWLQYYKCVADENKQIAHCGADAPNQTLRAHFLSSPSIDAGYPMNCINVTVLWANLHHQKYVLFVWLVWTGICIYYYDKLIGGFIS